MWQIKDFEIRKTEFDFSSSGQGKAEASQLIFENVVLMNAVEFIDFGGDSVQLIICDHCGSAGCGSGNWVCFRKSADYILLIPDFRNIEEESWSESEYTPPYYYDRTTHNKRKGTPYFEVDTYEQLRKSFPGFPSIGNIESLKMSEAMRLAQFNFPIKFFGDPPEISLKPSKRKLAIDSTEGDVVEHLQRIEAILRDNYENNSLATIRKPLSHEKSVYVFLDTSEFTDWKAMVKNGEDSHLLLEEEFVIESGS